jgi:hypothetical protein
MTDRTTISDRWRTPIIAEKREDGGIAIRGHFHGIVALSPAELQRLFNYAHDLGVLQRFPMAPKSPQTDE